MGRRARDTVGAALAAAILVAAPAAAQVYQWTDRDGTLYYTTDPRRIPAQYRDAARVLEASPQDPEREPGSVPGTILFAAGSPILAEVHLNGVPLTLLVDTGASRTVISPSILVRAGFDPSRGRLVRIVGVTGSAVAREVVVPRLDVAGAQIGPLRVLAHEATGVRADGLLGRDVLDQFTLTIDASRGRAILTR